MVVIKIRKTDGYILQKSKLILLSTCYPNTAKLETITLATTGIKQHFPNSCAIVLYLFENHNNLPSFLGNESCEMGDISGKMYSFKESYYHFTVFLKKINFQTIFTNK